MQKYGLCEIDIKQLPQNYWQFIELISSVLASKWYELILHSVTIQIFIMSTPYSVLCKGDRKRRDN